MKVPSTLPELDFKTLFPFELDDFQKDAIAALNANRSVVVCAPTGSGKTLIGEYAIYRALTRNRRVFYTTPLKALSNQKLRDFRNLFGAERVGLLTGDISINRDAPILVMTTEIFRNMLYGTPIGEVGTSLVGVEAVVLDECHYMNDRQRGTVWEESIIYCPPDIQLVALSATIANSQQLTDWLNRVHGSTELIYSDFRPVPLQFHFVNQKGMCPLLENDGKRINSRLRIKQNKNQPKNKREESPAIGFVISQLQERDMLPAIYFIFSRRGCERAVAELKSINLVNKQEAALLRKRIEEFILRSPEAATPNRIEPLSRGIAAHHAGILPAWKVLVEELFQEGLVKVVFATETLAAGINMPARTTVISSLSKRTDEGHRLLTRSEFLQMAGRAGRRGMDTTGYVVILQTPFEGAREAAYLATAGSDPLKSQFTPSYGMVLNLLQAHTLEESRNLIERSFGQYLATLDLVPQQQAIAHLHTELSILETELAKVDPLQINNYQKLQERIKEERRLLKTLEHQADTSRKKEIAIAIAEAKPGTIINLKGKHVPVSSPLPAVLYARVRGDGQSDYLICLGQNNRWYIATSVDVISLNGELPANLLKNFFDSTKSTFIHPPLDLSFKPGQAKKGTPETAQLASQIPYSLEPNILAPEVAEQLQHVQAIKALLDTHPLRQFGNPANLLKRHARRLELQAEINQRQGLLHKQSQWYWQRFLSLMEILQSCGCLELIKESEGSSNGVKLKPTSLGQSAAVIRGDNELWLGLALRSGELDDLDPHHLAAVCAGLVTEESRPDTWVNYSLSLAIDHTLNELQRNLRRPLFQLQRRYQKKLKNLLEETLGRSLPDEDMPPMPPIWLESELISLVEQWALGIEWQDLCENTSLDEGDIVRILRRTLDFLSQIPYVPHISESLYRNTIRAIQLIDRFPVNEEATA